MIKNNLFLTQQPVWIFIVVLLGIFSSSFSTPRGLMISYVFTIFYLLLAPFIFSFWFKIILKLLPFFISYFLLGIIFNIAFSVPILFSVKLSFFLLLGSYFVQTTSIDDFVQNSDFIRKYGIFYRSALFLLLTVNFIPLFFSEYEKFGKKSNNISVIISEALENTVSRIKEVESESIGQMEKKQIRKASFWNLPNLYLSFISLIYILCLSV